jgi:hypothetical protein
MATTIIRAQLLNYFIIIIRSDFYEYEKFKSYQ